MPQMLIPPFAVGVFDNSDWRDATQVKASLEGLLFGVVTKFPSGQLIYTSVANIDTDGPNGSTKLDPCWESETSLRYSNGVSVDSRAFPGIVIPPQLEQFGVKIGDFAYILWHANIVPCQVYDIGPHSKIGEISLYASRAVGVTPPTQSDRDAAVKGNNVNDLVTCIYCGSGPGHAISPDLIAQSCAQLRSKTTT